MKRTVIISKINDDHTGFVKNIGLDELSLFKKLKDNGVELKNEENISDGEMLMLLRHCCIDGFVEGVFNIENHYNRDQKQINILKEPYEDKLAHKGIEIVTHCDWQPSFSDDPSPINTRNYLTILCENIERKKKEYDSLCEDFDLDKNDFNDKRKRLEKELNEYKFECEKEKREIDKELENYNIDKRNRLDKELSDIEAQINENKEKIKKQNWYLEKTKEYEVCYNEYKKKFDTIVERYKNGQKACEQQENEARQKWPKELNELEIKINNSRKELNELTEEKHIIKKEIEELKPEFDYMKNQMMVYESELDSILQKYQ